jgi:hypothetical protein
MYPMQKTVVLRMADEAAGLMTVTTYVIRFIQVEITDVTWLNIHIILHYLLKLKYFSKSDNFF